MQVLCRAELQPQGGYHERWIVSGLCGGKLQLDARGIGPETLEFVVVAGLGIEDVNDHVPVVEQHPLGVIFAFASKRPLIDRLLEGVLHVLNQALDVATRSTGSDEEEVGQNNQFGYIEQGEVEALLVGDDLGSLFGGGYGFCVGADRPASPCRSW